MYPTSVAEMIKVLVFQVSKKRRAESPKYSQGRIQNESVIRSIDASIAAPIVVIVVVACAGVPEVFVCWWTSELFVVEVEYCVLDESP